MARFEAVVMVSTVWLKSRAIDQGYAIEPTYLDGRKVIRIMYIKRTDTFAGL